MHHWPAGAVCKASPGRVNVMAEDEGDQVNREILPDPYERKER